MLRAAASSPYPPTKPNASPLQFDLEVVTDQLPTKDQIKIISSYLPNGGLSSLLSDNQQVTSPDKLLSVATKDLSAFKWPVVVDWTGGKASIGDVEGVKEILENIRKKRDGEIKEEEVDQPKGWFS